MQISIQTVPHTRSSLLALPANDEQGLPDITLHQIVAWSLEIITTSENTHVSSATPITVDGAIENKLRYALYNPEDESWDVPSHGTGTGKEALLETFKEMKAY